jgi:hypothetical protein
VSLEARAEERRRTGSSEAQKKLNPSIADILINGTLA